jgi:hypothetical protein
MRGSRGFRSSGFGRIASMKHSTALKQSKGLLGFLAVAVPCLWGLHFWLRDWTLAGIAAFMSLYLVVEVWNVVRIWRAARKDPEFLKKHGREK